MVLDKGLLRVPWTARNQPRIFTGRTDAGTLILLPADEKSWLTGKDPEAGKDWGQDEKGPTEDEMVGWHQRLNGQESEQTLGDSEGQGKLACYNPWGSQKVAYNWAVQQQLLLYIIIIYI